MKRVPKYQKNPKLPILNKLIEVNRDELNPASLNSYFVPEYYSDKICTCRKCKAEFIFSAVQQKQLYETHKRHIATDRVLCGKCKLNLNNIINELSELESKIGPKNRERITNKDDVCRVIALLDMKYLYTGVRDTAKSNRFKKLYESLTSH